MTPSRSSGRPDRPRCGDDAKLFTRADRRPRHRGRAAREGSGLRRGRDDQQRRRPVAAVMGSRTGSVPTWPSRPSASRTFELCAELIRPGGRECRRARARRDAPSRAAVDPRRHNHDRARGHLHDTEADATDRRGRLDPTPFATHRFELEETMEAYETFADAATTNALKVVLSGHPVPRSRQGDACRDRLAHHRGNVERVLGRARRALRDGTSLRLRSPALDGRRSPVSSRASRRRASTAFTVCRRSARSSWSRFSTRLDRVRLH